MPSLSEPPLASAGSRGPVKLQNLHLEHERLMDCIHCGLCLSACPTYAQNGNEADSPRGRIYLMRGLYEGRLEPTPDVVEHLDLCLGCRACETACPSGVQYGTLIEGTRAHLREIGTPRSLREKLILKGAEMSFPYPNRLELLLVPVRVLRRTGLLPLARKLGLLKPLGYLGDLEMLLPPLPSPRRRRRFPVQWPARGSAQGKVGMVTGCVMPVMLPQVNEATARVLAQVGCDVAAPPGQVCCGAMHAHTGAMETAKGLARQNLEAFERWEHEHGTFEAVVINAAGCGSALKEYPNWFHGEPEWEARAHAFALKVRDVSEVLVQPRYLERLRARLAQRQGASAPAPTSIPEPALAAQEAPRESPPNTTGAHSVQGAGTPVPRPSAERLAATTTPTTTPTATAAPPPAATARLQRVTYHDACHLAHGQGIRVPPRELLGLLPGLDVVPLAESEMCCGSAGTYNITQPDMALQLLERKMEHVRATGATVCATGNPGCALQLMLGARKFGVAVAIKHPIELIDDATR